MNRANYEVVHKPFNMTAIPSPSKPVPRDSKAFDRSLGRKWKPKGKR
jgi:hypothetical protein